MSNTKEIDRPPIEKNIGVPVDKGTLREVEKMSASEDRPVGAMARILIKEALRARGVEIS